MKQKKTQKMLGIACLVILLSSLFFSFLYSYQNRYTYSESEDEIGNLDLTKQELSTQTFRFLAKEWVFYPDVLLTPESYQSGVEKEGFSYQNLQRIPNLVNGQGSYVLHLRLPEEEETYGLELFRIFSAYRIYIDDEMMLQVGDMEEDAKGISQNRMITFTRGGDVTIIIAVNNYTNFTGGLRHPPLFGTPLAVNFMRGVRLGLHVLLSALSLLLFIMSLYMAFRMKRTEMRQYSLLCLTAGLYLFFPILYSSRGLPISPWNGLEHLCSNLIVALVVMLYNEMNGLPVKVKKISNWTAFALSCFLFMYSLFFQGMFSFVNASMPGLFLCYCMLASCYLVGVSIYSLKENAHGRWAMFAASIVAVTSCIYTVIRPLYEPVFVGKFWEYGFMAVVVMVTYTLWKHIITSYKHQIYFEQENCFVLRQIQIQKDYTHQLGKHLEENRRLTHDFRHHLRVIGSLAESEGKVSISDYIEQIANTLTTSRRCSKVFLCSNIALDALLRYYTSVAEERGIKIEQKLFFPEHFPLSDVELCTLFGNLIENAIEGCQNQTMGQRIIRMKANMRAQIFVFSIENTYSGKVIKKGDSFLSHKKGYEQIGIGIKSVVHIMEKYNGVITFTTTDRDFKAVLTMGILPFS